MAWGFRTRSATWCWSGQPVWQGVTCHVDRGQFRNQLALKNKWRYPIGCPHHGLSQASELCRYGPQLVVSSWADDKKGYTPQKKTLTKGGTLCFVDSEVSACGASALLSKKPNVRRGGISDLRAESMCFIQALEAS